MAQGQKHEHHYVPRHYLNGFSPKGREKFVWAYTKGTEYNPGEEAIKKFSPCLISTVAVAKERDFYAVPSPDGSIDFESIENALEKHEVECQPAINKIRDRILISKDEKMLLADYIATMWKRTKYFRRDPYNIWDKNKEEMFSALTKQMADYEDAYRHDEKIMLNIVAIKDFLSDFYNRFDNEENKKRVFNSIVISEIELVTRGIFLKNWGFMVNESPSPYLTSDHPVSFDKRGGIKRSDITFPIS